MTDDIVENYQKKVLEDFGLQSASAQEQRQALELVGERLHKVIIYTILERLNDEQKQRFAQALENKETAEDKVAEIAAEVRGLEQAIEQALLSEYTALKESMKS